MKKIIPALLISTIFGVMLIFQMLIHGQKLTATQLKEQKAKYQLYENEVRTLLQRDDVKATISKNDSVRPILIVNFWASWCTPCISEFKSLNKLLENKELAKHIRVLGINNDTENAAKIVKKTQDEYKLKFPSILNESGSIASSFEITNIPASIVLHEGKVIYFTNKEFDFTNPEFINLLESKIN